MTPLIVSIVHFFPLVLDSIVLVVEFQFVDYLVLYYLIFQFVSSRLDFDYLLICVHFQR